MKYFALIAGALSGATEGDVNEVFTDPKEFDGVEYPLSELYHPTLLAALIECPEYVTAGYSYSLADDGTWTAPEAMAATMDTGNGEPPPR